MPPASGYRRGAWSLSTACADTEPLFDLRHDPVGGIEELRVHLLPAPDVSDREELRARRELREALPLHSRPRRSGPALCPDRLRGRRIEPVAKPLRGRVVGAFHCGE